MSAPILLIHSVWDLIHRDCDLAWSAVNTYYILGIIGFVGMLWLRAYVMLLASKASRNLMTAASTGTAAALCLMVSIVNRGVENGGGLGNDGGLRNIRLGLDQHVQVNNKASLTTKRYIQGRW